MSTESKWECIQEGTPGEFTDLEYYFPDHGERGMKLRISFEHGKDNKPIRAYASFSMDTVSGDEVIAPICFDLPLDAVKQYFELGALLPLARSLSK